MLRVVVDGVSEQASDIPSGSGVSGSGPRPAGYVERTNSIQRRGMPLGESVHQPDKRPL